MLKFRSGFGKIEALEVLRETEKQVVVLSNRPGGKERLENKRSDFTNWHDTWEGAHAFLIAEAENEVESLRMKLDRAKGKLGQIKGMHPDNKAGRNWTE